MSLPRLATVSIVRNEADIIETFVRHHVGWTTRMVFVLHRCIDNTGHILQKLQEEGLPLHIHEETDPGFPQSSVLTQRIQKIIVEDIADWIAPLDADEFLVAAEGGNVLETLATFGTDRVQMIPWRTYVPTPEDDMSESNPIRRIVQRKNPELPPIRKVFLPVPLLRSIPWKLPMGCHDILHGVTGEALPSIASATLSLAHFPVRSSEQCTAKILGGWVALAASPDGTNRQASHWHGLAERCADGRTISIGELRNIALRYGIPEGTLSVPGLIRDPTRTETGRPRHHIERTHPLTVLADVAIAQARNISDEQRAQGEGTPGRNDLEALGHALQKGIYRLEEPLNEAMMEGVPSETALGDPHASALVCGLAIVAACALGSDRAGSALTRRQRLATALPSLSKNLQWIRSILDANKLPSTLENAIQEIMRVLAAADMAAHGQECRRENASDDLLLALAERMTRAERPPIPLPLATFLAQTIHHILMSDAKIPMGLADAHVRTIDPFCSRGEIAGEMLRRTVHASLEHGANPDQLRRDILGRMHLKDTAPTLRGITALRLSVMLDTLRMPLREGETLPITGKEPREEMLTVEKDMIPVVCTALTGEVRRTPLGAEAKEMLSLYVRSLRRSGMDRDAESSQVLRTIAEAHALLKHAERGVGSFIAPRSILHAYAAAGMREMLLQDFEQVCILDLSGQPAHADASDSTDDEPVDGADRSGTCILLLLRAPEATQRTLFMEWRGLKLQKYHALLSRAFPDLPWQVIAPDTPGYVFLGKNQSLV